MAKILKQCLWSAIGDLYGRSPIVKSKYDVVNVAC